MRALTDVQKTVAVKRHRLAQLFLVPRNRRATVASLILMYDFVFLGVYCKA